MTPILCLFIHGGIPIGIIEYDTVGACEIDPDPAAPRGGDEAEDLLVEVELVHESLSHLHLHWAVEAHVSVAVQVQEVLEDVQDARHLSEDKHFVAFLVQVL